MKNLCSNVYFLRHSLQRNRLCGIWCSTLGRCPLYSTGYCKGYCRPKKIIMVTSTVCYRDRSTYSMPHLRSGNMIHMKLDVLCYKDSIDQFKMPKERKKRGGRKQYTANRTRKKCEPQRNNPRRDDRQKYQEPENRAYGWKPCCPRFVIRAGPGP